MKKQLQKVSLIIAGFFFLSLTASAVVTVTAPNGGEIYMVGSTQKVTWTGGGNGNATISYSIDGGSNYTYVATVGSFGGTYNWLIPNTPSTKCLIKVAEGSTSQDVSDAVFTIMSSTSGIGNVANVTGKQVVVYPNPATDNLNIAAGNGVQSVKIYNMIGNLVKEISFADATLAVQTISVADLAKGTYFAEINLGEAMVTEKITVIK